MKAKNLPKKLKHCSGFSVSRRPQKWTKRKSCIIWMRHQHITQPVAYISKPKHIPQQLFDEFMDSIQIQLLAFPNTPQAEQLNTTAQ